jgi:hypothetical protein
MFRDWENFYLIVGSAAGALIGLMFVVATLMAGLEAKRVSRDARVFFTPIIFHFAVVVVISAIAVVPGMPAPAAGVIVVFCAVIGFAYSIATIFRLFAPGSEVPPIWSDKYLYGFVPAIAYLGLVCAAGAVWLAPGGAAYAIGATMLVLLLIGIRDAWDLAICLLQGSRERAPPASER